MTRATLLTWTVLRAPPPGHPAGRVVGLVEFEDGSRVFAVGASEAGLAVGRSVEVDLGRSSFEVVL